MQHVTSGGMYPDGSCNMHLELMVFPIHLLTIPPSLLYSPPHPVDMPCYMPWVVCI